jgi:hypothetical protein
VLKDVRIGKDQQIVAANLSTVIEMYAWVAVAEPLCGSETASQGRNDGTSSRRCVVGGGEDAVLNLLVAARRLAVGYGTLVAIANAVYI